MRLLTDEQHAQIETAIDDFHSAGIFRPSCQEGAIDRCKCFPCATDRIIAALATLTAAPSLEVVGVTNSCEVDYMQSKEEAMGAMFKVGGERAHNEDADIELYAIKKETP